MTIIKDTYFKLTHDERVTQISGRHLPDPDAGPYNFHDCEFHPRLWAAWRQLYARVGSVLTGTSYAGPRTYAETMRETYDAPQDGASQP